MKPVRIITVVASAAIILSACSTPQEVRDMAALASANMAKVQTNLGNFVKSANAANKKFAERISLIETRAKDRAAGFEKEKAIDVVLSGTKAAKANREFLDALSDATDKETVRISGRLESPAVRAKEILDGLSKTKVDPKQFQAVVGPLGELAKEEGTAERIAALLKFLSDVGKEISKQQEAATKASN